MLSTKFFSNHIIPTIFPITIFDRNESILSCIKSSAAKEIVYFLIVDNNTPLGIVKLHCLMEKIDRLHELNWQVFINKDFA